MKHLYKTSALALIIATQSVNAQHTITNGDNSLEISGMVSVYYNQRYLKQGETNLNNNRFRR